MILYVEPRKISATVEGRAEMSAKKREGEPKRGRPRTQHIAHIDATPEEVARAMFAAVEPPDPSKRKKKKRA